MKKVGEVSLILIISSTFKSYLSLSDFWCLFCMFTSYLSDFFVFHMKKLILLNLISWYVTSTSQWFLNSQDIVELCKVNVWLFIECNTDSFCEHKTGGVNIYLYGYVILLVPVCAVCLWLFVWYQIIVLAKKSRRMLDFCKPIPCCIKHTTRSLWYYVQGSQGYVKQNLEKGGRQYGGGAEGWRGRISLPTKTI